MEFKDYYKTLGLDKTASEDEIKKAYRKKVRKYHPDVSKEPDADKKTKEVNEAYGVLGDQDKRAAYDEMGGRYQPGQKFRPPPESEPGFDFFGAGNDEDFFADLFANVGRRRGGGAYQARGQDIHASIAIDLSDAYHGATRAITLHAPQIDAQGRTLSQQRTLNVNIPKGITQGQQLRLSGQGQPGSGYGPAGDLYLEVRFKPDPRFQVEGRDVTQRVAVAPWECALGSSIDVATPSGAVQVSVPPNSQTGRKLRLKARGIPGDPPGNLYLVLEVVLPPANTDKARQLYETMARQMAFNPRQKMGV